MSMRNFKLGYNFLLEIINFAKEIRNRPIAMAVNVSFNIYTFFLSCDLSCSLPYSVQL